MRQKNFKPSFRRRLFRMSLIGLGIYAAVCLGCAGWQRGLIFVPPHFTAAQMEKSAQAASLERWINPQGQAIGMKRLAPRQPSLGRVLIVYGNGSWTCGCARYVDGIQSVAPCDVYILEYPGYADRPGSPSQEKVFRAADEAVQLLGTNQPIYLLGESLGTGVASYLAGAYPNTIGGVMLLSPYDRLTGVAQHKMPFLPVKLLLVDRFPSVDYLRNYHGPVGIMVDGRDNVIPEKFGLRLYEAYTGPKRLWRFPDGDHISIREPPAQFWREVLDFWQSSQITTQSSAQRITS